MRFLGITALIIDAAIGIATMAKVMPPSHIWDGAAWITLGVALFWLCNE